MTYRDIPFAPLLPLEQAPLAERVATLAEWCGGFLYGIGAAGAELAFEDLAALRAAPARRQGVH